MLVRFFWWFGAAIFSACNVSQKAMAPPHLELEILAFMEDANTKMYFKTDRIPASFFRIVKRVSRQAEHIYNEEYALANPQEPFRSGCVPQDGWLSRRLVFVCKNGKTTLVCYERGGRAHNLLLSYVKNGQYFNLSLKLPGEAYGDYSAIKLALKEARFLLTYPSDRFVPF